MSIIPKSQIKSIVFSMNTAYIKSLMGRQRLKFSLDEIVMYVTAIYEHQLLRRRFKALYRHLKLEISYEAFMKNLRVISPIVAGIHAKILQRGAIVASSLINYVDSSLLTTKESRNIRSKDYVKHMVTSRKKEKFCGYKGLVFMNRFKQIYHASLHNINVSDNNFLKDIAYYADMLKGVMLMDMGFSNRISRERFKYVADKATMISPFKKKQKKQLTTKEWRVYRHRWGIELLFKALKDEFGNFNLNLKGARNLNIVKAKFYATISSYNLTTVSL